MINWLKHHARDQQYFEEQVPTVIQVLSIYSYVFKFKYIPIFITTIVFHALDAIINNLAGTIYIVHGWRLTKFCICSNTSMTLGSSILLWARSRTLTVCSLARCSRDSTSDRRLWERFRVLRTGRQSTSQTWTNLKINLPLSILLKWTCTFIFEIKIISAACVIINKLTKSMFTFAY